MSYHPPMIKAPPLYLASLHVSKGARLLMQMVVWACTRGRVFCPGRSRVGEILHVSERTVGRYLEELKAGGWILVRRRGRKLTNVYRLARWLWERLTGRFRSPLPSELQESLWRLGEHLGVDPRRMASAGVSPGSPGPRVY